MKSQHAFFFVGGMKLKRVRWAILPILLCVGVWGLFRTVFFVGIVPSSSMEPAIPAGSVILGSRIFSELGRGDIIVFRHGGKTLVKRIVAVGGDAVSLDDQDCFFAVNQELATATRVLTVPEGCFFVVGDNREESLDSRVWENPFLTADEVIAVAVGAFPFASE